MARSALRFPVSLCYRSLEGGPFFVRDTSQAASLLSALWDESRLCGLSSKMHCLRISKARRG